MLSDHLHDTRMRSSPESTSSAGSGTYVEADLPGIPQAPKRPADELASLVSIAVLQGTDEVRRAGLSTRGQVPLGEDDDPLRGMSLARWRQWLESEHSPIRQFRLRVVLNGVGAATSVHFARHVHLEHYVQSQRPDRSGLERDPDRPVMHTIYGNAQGFIELARKRLCSKAAPETRAWMEAIREAMRAHEDPYVRVLGEWLMPNCAYRRKCPEFDPCGLERVRIMDHRGSL